MCGVRGYGMLKGLRLHGQPQKGVLLLRMRRRYRVTVFSLLSPPF